jgi:Leucine-rich repeat (LRR) protein
MKMKTIILLLISFLFFPGFIYGDIPAEERAALIAFYHAAKGDNWDFNTGWKTPPLAADGFAMPGTEGTWFGIVVTNDHVTEIHLVLNNLTGSMTSKLGNLTGLEYLDLSFNPLTGPIPPELGNLNSLEKLWLSSISLTGSIPGELGNLGNLLELSLSDTQLSGSIPSELGNLEKLGYLDLNLCQLTGSIPVELGNLKNLTSLNLSDNKLSGSIPSALGKLGKLEYLYLGGTQLSGTIPPELGNLANLRYLGLNNNHLTGSIPPELGNLSILNALFLSSNRLSGGIPSELKNLSELEYLYLGSNRLTGAVPIGLTNLSRLFYLNIGYNGLYTDDNGLRTFLTGLDPGWADTQTIAPANVTAAQSPASSITISWTPITYTADSGGYEVYYSTTPGGPWTYVGKTADKTAGSYIVGGLSPGTTYYFVVKTQTHPHNNNKNTVVSEYSEEASATTGALEDKEPPFGFFDTPIDGSTVVSSIPVTGWALDDTGIDTVKIYRQQGTGFLYIGDATLVEGARPDVSAAYPQYPNNTRAGWGYMMLTNFLPDGGNGTFVIYAIATDRVGNTTTLGTKTIHCDNVNAVKPFGAIDTPTQGGTASGNRFVNFGWVLTPLPNIVPIDGSTITVWVDGVPLGHPVYNQYRADIATLFPGYNNSNGAVGYFYLDTTAYENGVHSIQWTAADDAGNTDGIGSRYFTIQNGSQSAKSTAQNEGIRRGDSLRLPISDRTIPIDYSRPIRIRKGYNNNIEPQIVYPGEDGTIYIEIKELERLEIHLSDSEESTLSISSLPIGSMFDSARGVFSWQPGPGFIGEYRFVFVEKGPGGLLIRKNINVKIIPKF